MRFVSMYARLNLGTVQKEKWVLAVTGERDLMAESVSVQFGQEYIMQDDIDFALSKFPESDFKGRWLEADGVTLEPLTTRIGVFDSEIEADRQGWDEATRAMVDTYVLNHKAYGISFVKVEPVEKVVEKPWKTYDSTHHFKVHSLAAELGCIEEALAYERANKAREGVIEKLEEQLSVRPKAESEESGEVVAA